MIRASTPEALRRRKTTVICFFAGGSVVAAAIGISRSGALDGFVKSSAEDSDAPAGPKVLRHAPASSLLSARYSGSSSYPSLRPSISFLPTDGPGRGPTALEPTEYPTATNTNLRFVNAPSYAPSTTNFPSTSPTTSLNPTEESSKGTFSIRMHWQTGYMWQELPDEGWFCLACARCDLNNIFFGMKGCDIETHCEENMHLALTGCAPSKLGPAKMAEIASFKFLFDGDEYGLDGDQIQVHGTNLCIQQVLPGGTGSVELRRCDSSLKAQRFWGARPVEQPMELLPVSGNFAKCLTNQQVLSVFLFHRNRIHARLTYFSFSTWQSPPSSGGAGLCGRCVLNSALSSDQLSA